MPDFPDALLVGLVVLGEVGGLQLPGLHLEVAAAHGLVLCREPHVVRAQGVCLRKEFKEIAEKMDQISIKTPNPNCRNFLKIYLKRDLAALSVRGPLIFKVFVWGGKAIL